MFIVLRTAFVLAIIVAVVYGLIWLLLATPYFKDKARNGRILRRVLFLSVSVAIAVALLNFYLTFIGH